MPGWAAYLCFDFYQVPLNVMEDRLLGSVDVEESVKEVSNVLVPYSVSA